MGRRMRLTFTAWPLNANQQTRRLASWLLAQNGSAAGGFALDAYCYKSSFSLKLSPNTVDSQTPCKAAPDMFQLMRPVSHSTINLYCTHAFISPLTAKRAPQPRRVPTDRMMVDEQATALTPCVNLIIQKCFNTCSKLVCANYSTTNRVKNMFVLLQAKHLKPVNPITVKGEENRPSGSFRLSPENQLN